MDKILPRKEVSTKPVAVHADLDRRRAFHNRVAHHEPVFQRRLDVEFSHLVRLTRLICTVTADWVVTNSRGGEVLSLRPTPHYSPACPF